MKMNDFQTQAAAFAINNDLNHMVFGLVEEAGECAGLLKRYHRGDTKYQNLAIYKDGELERVIFAPMLTAALEKELGDTLWYVAMTAARIGLTLEQVAATNIKKLNDRAQRNVIAGEGDNR